MPLNAVDYSTELAKVRNNFNRALKENIKNKEYEVNRLQDNFDNRTQAAQENYSKAKGDLEKTYEKNMDYARGKTTEDLDHLQGKFQEQVFDIRNHFDKSRADEQRNFYNRLQDISHSYRLANKYEKENHNNLQRLSEKRYRRQLVKQRDESDSRVDDFIERAQESTEQASIQQDDERKQLIKSYRNEIQKTRDTGEKRRLRDVEEKDDQIRALQDTYAQEKNFAKDNFSESLKFQEEKNERLMKDLQHNYDDVVGDLTNRGQKGQILMRRNFKQDISDLNRLNQKEKLFLQRKIMDLNKNRGLTQEMDSRMSEKAKLDNQRQFFSNIISKMNRDFEDRNKELREAYLNDIDEKKLVSSEKEADLVKRYNRELTEKELDAKRSEDKITSFYRERDKLLNTDFQTRYDNFKQFNEEKREEERVRFNETVDKVVENNYEILDNLRRENAEKQKKLILEKERERYNTINELKGDYHSRIHDKEKLFNKIIKKKNEEIESLKDFYETKMETSLKKSIRDGRYKDFLVKEQHQEDIDGMRDLLLTKEKDYAQRMNNFKDKYDRKLDDYHKAYRSKVTNIIERFEEDIASLRLDRMKEVRKLNGNHKKELTRLQNEHENRVSRMVLGYEDKIRSIKSNSAYEIHKLEKKINELQK